ncbi:hypothetical protein C7H85_02170 [Zobellella endophytica]|uniref:GrpB family protein n=1 Tax=Zobellella endophytica TaxID=2116700 RepID=A0A2P7RBP2_9GAMM|nr:GrpB family protein [Zobellella endophytica]PSJ47658.1 hypothetical protein C7H85_02170 [Zobellella endophytica]
MSLREIVVRPYCACWPGIFIQEKAAIEHALGDVGLAVHHIGSTAVPGLMAKPIIDILLVVDSLARLDRASPRLEAQGYEAKGEFGMPGRRYFPKGGLDRTHQIHAFEQGSGHIERHLAFRDYLIAFPDIAAQYQALKQRVAASCGNDLARYCQGKDDFIKTHEALALAWRARAGT